MKRVTALILTALIISSLLSTAAADEIPFEIEDKFEVYEISYPQNIDDGVYYYYDDGKIGYKNLKGEVIIETILKEAGGFHEGLSFAKLGVVEIGGYIDTTGDFILPPVFSFGTEFKNGKAVVRIYDAMQIINKKGEFLLPKNYEYVVYDELLDGYLCMTDDRKTDIYDSNISFIKAVDAQIYSLVKVKGKLFMYAADENGYNYVMSYDDNKIILDKINGNYYDHTDDFFYVPTHEYSAGILSYYLGGAVCYDIEGNVFSDFGFDIISILDENTHYGFNYLEDEEKYDSYIVENGKKKPYEYAVMRVLSEAFMISINDNKKFGVIDKAGKIIVPFEYEDVRECTDDYVVLPKDDDIHIFFKDGKLVKTIEDAVHFYHLDGYYSYQNQTNADVILLDENFNEYMSIRPKNKEDATVSIYGGTISVWCGGKNYAVVEKDKFKVNEYEKLAPVKYDNLEKFRKENTVFLKLDSFKCRENGEYKLLDDDVFTTRPYLENSLTMVPISLISRSFDTFCYYDEYEKTVEFSHYNKCVILKIDSDIAEVTALVGNEIVTSNITLPAKVKLSEGRTMVPLRAISELLDKNVFWHDSGLIGVSNNELSLTNEEIESLNDGLTSYAFTPEELARIDASLATQPFTDYLSAKLLEISEIENAANYSNTIPGYEALISGEKDIILVTEPSEEMLKKAEAAGVELEVVPFSKEGFVFLVNSENKVDNLTDRQIKDIYGGKILNWNEVGGENLEIRAYQRNESSGSQTIMENYFMKDDELMEPATDRLITSMGGLIEVIAEFDENSNRGIGYSVYYYAKTMYGTDKVRLIKVNGVEPTTETIKDDSYPLIVNYYIVTRKGDNSELTKKLSEFILSEAGQKYVEESGLVGVY